MKYEIFVDKKTFNEKKYLSNIHLYISNNF